MMPTPMIPTPPDPDPQMPIMTATRSMMPQGTIKSFDPESKSGTLVTDDQRELRFDTDTFMASGLEELRLGQRVRFELSGDGGRIRGLNLVSF
jgi:cold shock CspA family protein